MTFQPWRWISITQNFISRQSCAQAPAHPEPGILHAGLRAAQLVPKLPLPLPSETGKDQDKPIDVKTDIISPCI